MSTSTDYFTDLDLQDLAPGSRERYKSCIRSYLGWLEGIPAIPDTARQFIAYLRQRGYSPATLQLYYVTIKAYLAYHNMALKLKLRQAHPLPPYHSTGEITRLLESATRRRDRWRPQLSERNELLILLLAYTGLRRAEVVHLKVGDINLPGQVLYVRQGKGGKDRSIPLAPEIIRSLRKYISRYRFDTHERLFPLSGRQVYSIIKDSAARSGNPALHPHSLRHYFATQLLEHGVNIRQVQQLLGHADISSTAVYLDLCPQHLHQAVKRLPPLKRRRRRG